MARRDIMDEPPAYETLFDTSAQLPNYASIATSPSSPSSSSSPSRAQSPIYTSALSRRGSDDSSASSSDGNSSSRRQIYTARTLASMTNTNSSSGTDKKEKKEDTANGGGFLSRWRADLAEDRARRAQRVVHVSPSEADRIVGRADARSARAQRGEVRWRVYYEASGAGSEKQR